MVEHKWVASDGTMFAIERDAEVWEQMTHTRALLSSIIQAASIDMSVAEADSVADIVMKDGRVVVVLTGEKDVRVLPREEGGTA